MTDQRSSSIACQGCSDIIPVGTCMLAVLLLANPTQFPLVDSRTNIVLHPASAMRLQPRSSGDACMQSVDSPLAIRHMWPSCPVQAGFRRPRRNMRRSRHLFRPSYRSDWWFTWSSKRFGTAHEPTFFRIYINERENHAAVGMPLLRYVLRFAVI